jgi:hypothetical protein
MHVFHDIKLEIIQWTGLPRDALHIYVGLLIFLGAAALLKRPLAGRAPILAVLLAALAGETWDVLETWRGGETIHWWRNWHDIWNTLFWPTALFLLARYTRVLKRA